MNIKEKMEQMQRNSIMLKIDGRENYKRCATRFGGKPDVPVNFIWPTYEGEGYDNVRKTRFLTFLAQFNCEELSVYDMEHLLPDHGLLSFFYETDSQRWGFDPGDRGCARVFWFEDTSVLSAADFPTELEEDFRFPMVSIGPAQEMSYPDWTDFSEVFPDVDDEVFDAIWMELCGETPDVCSKLLGWPDVIQNSMAAECALVTQGYYLGSGWGQVPEEVRRQAEETSLDNWLLLFQLDTVECDDFELMFGDCGRVYFYIKKEDLMARRFDQVWLILQCY